MGSDGVKTGRIYIKLYMSVFIRQKFFHPPKVFLSETTSGELPKNLLICFKGTLAPLLLDTTKASQSYLLVLNFKQQISPKILKLQITENHLKPPINICNHSIPTITTRNYAQSARIYLELALNGLKPPISM